MQDLPSNSINKADLARAIAAKADITIEQADRFLQSLADQVLAELASGGRVRLIGFGSFETRRIGPRMVRNPRTGEVGAVKESTLPRFIPGAALRAQVNR